MTRDDNIVMAKAAKQGEIFDDMVTYMNAVINED